MNPQSEIILYLYTPVPLEGLLFDDARRSGFRFPGTLDEWVSEEWRHMTLRRGDGLLAWRWADGAVVDEQPAADADVDAAMALFVAAGGGSLRDFLMGVHASPALLGVDLKIFSYRPPLIGLPLIIALGFRPEAGTTEETIFEILGRISGNLAGYLFALVGVGIIVTIFALVSPRTAAEAK